MSAMALKSLSLSCLIAAVVGVGSIPASAMSLREAVNIALVTNPQIGQAIANRSAIEAELRQAQGLYLPRVDLQGSAGLQKYESESTSFSPQFGPGGNLTPIEADLVVTQKLFDGYSTQASVEGASARLDGGAFRVWERSENIALSVAREYVQAILQQRVVALAQENVAFHTHILAGIDDAVKSGTLTDADRFQAEERLTAATAKVKEAEEALSAAKIRFFTLVGKPISNLATLPAIAAAVPRSVDQALSHARTNNPSVAIAWADADAADALVKRARSKYMPEIYAEGTARTGYDIDLTPGHTNDLEARLVARFNVYDGGIKSAAEQEEILRASEQHLKVEEEVRAIDEQVRLAWDTRTREADIGKTLAKQVSQDAEVVSSYQDQFKVGRRSLLDVLDAQNTRFNVAVLRETSNYASLFADYQLLAATGELLKALNVDPPAEAHAYGHQWVGMSAKAPEGPLPQ